MNRQINGVNVIHYVRPTGKEWLRDMAETFKTKERLEKELKSSGPKLKEKISAKELSDQLREILEINERTSLQEKVEATGCDY